MGMLRCVGVAAYGGPSGYQTLDHCVLGVSLVFRVYREKLIIVKIHYDLTVCLSSFCNSPLERYFSREFFHTKINLGHSRSQTWINFLTAPLWAEIGPDAAKLPKHTAFMHLCICASSNLFWIGNKKLQGIMLYKNSL